MRRFRLSAALGLNTAKASVDIPLCMHVLARVSFGLILFVLSPRLCAQEHKIPWDKIEAEVFPDEPFCKECLNITGLDEKTKLAFNVEWRLNWTGEVPGVNSIGNVPVSLRQIPGHQDDPWAGQIFTVPNRTISGLNAHARPWFYFAGDVTVFQRLAVRLGATDMSVDDLSDLFISRDKLVSAAYPYLAEINQFGTAQRGTGTALVFYAVVPRSAGQFVFTPEVEYRVWQWFSILAGDNHYSLGYD